MIPIFLISDEKYAPYLCTTIVSILENTARTCAIYILDGGILPDTRLQIQETAQRYPHLHVIEFIGIDKEKFAKFPDVMHFSLNMYFRYLIPELKPELNKALYIDSDMIVTSDIGELYDCDLHSKPLAAVPYRDERPDLAHKRSSNEHEELGLSKDHLYFNSGLLILDCQQFRARNWVSKLLDITEKYAKVLKYPDQDALNILVDGNYYVLDDKWNAVVDINLVYEVLPDTLPAVLHFTGGSNTRPWMSFSCPYREIFDAYASSTPFAKKIYAQRIEHEICDIKSILTKLAQAEYNRKRFPLYRLWMRLTGQRKKNQQAYNQWGKLLSRLSPPR